MYIVIWQTQHPQERGKSPLSPASLSGSDQTGFENESAHMYLSFLCGLVVLPRSSRQGNENQPTQQLRGCVPVPWTERRCQTVFVGTLVLWSLQPLPAVNDTPSTIFQLPSFPALRFGTSKIAVELCWTLIALRRLLACGQTEYGTTCSRKKMFYSSSRRNQRLSPRAKNSPM